MSKIENIKTLFRQVDHKGKFILASADEFGVTPQTIKSNWLCDSGFWSVPKKHQDRLVELLQRQVQKQNLAEQP